MRVVGLVSGGKDSCYNMMQCVGAGHSIVALANLRPQQRDELDSYMYQTVGHQCIDLYAEAMDLPLYRQPITGVAIEQGRTYSPKENDEVEDLYKLLSKVKEDLAIEAVAVGAILSDYQRIRVENVCIRLGLVSLAYLWRRNQKELLQEMIDSGVESIIIKVAALGLDPKVHLGLTLKEIQPHLLVMQEKYGLNICGEGGEYETFTLDCPLFKKKLVIDERDLVMHSDDPVAPVGYLNLKMHLEQKDNFDEIKLPPTVKSSIDYINDLSDKVFSDISDIELSETELESLEKLEKEEKKKKIELNPLLTDCGDNSKTTTDSVDLDDDCDDGLINEDISLNVEDIQPVEDHSSIRGNKHGWYFIGGIVGQGQDTGPAAEDAINKLIRLLESENLSLRDICSVNIYMRNMEEYADLNKVYVDNFIFDNPPTRVCVEVPLPNNVGLIMDAVAHKIISSPESDICKERLTMHVQGISHWAPANIGPYSQAIKVGEVIVTCGQIALVPGSMSLVGGGARRQCALALRHLTRVIRALHPRAHIRSVVQSVCYTTSQRFVSEARRQLERRTAGAIVQYAVVRALPRHAKLEWTAWAHTDNNRFDYEETGCNIGDYKVAITRRWNYENTVAAFVCYVSKAGGADGDLTAVLRYALRKILPPGDSGCALKIRIFYQASSECAGLVLSSLHQAATAEFARPAVTLVPVVALHDHHCWLSISGLRLDE